MDSLGYELINGDVAGLCARGNAGVLILYWRPGQEGRGEAEGGCNQESIKTCAQIHGADPFSNGYFQVLLKRT